MTSITPLLSSGYYALESKTANDAPSTTTETLAKMLAGQKAAVATGNGSSASYMLDLSDDAKKYLEQWGGSSAASSSTAPTDADAVFTLSRLQQQKIVNILQKYKDEPFTQDTFNNIQDDLDDAGLSAERLAAIEQVRSVNPTNMLLSALSGQSMNEGQDLLSSGASAKETRTAKSNNYIRDVIAQWSDLSTTIDDEPTA